MSAETRRAPGRREGGRMTPRPTAAPLVSVRDTLTTGARCLEEERTWKRGPTSSRGTRSRSSIRSAAPRLMPPPSPRAPYSAGAYEPTRGTRGVHSSTRTRPSSRRSRRIQRVALGLGAPRPRSTSLRRSRRSHGLVTSTCYACAAGDSRRWSTSTRWRTRRPVSVSAPTTRRRESSVRWASSCGRWACLISRWTSRPSAWSPGTSSSSCRMAYGPPSATRSAPFC